MILSYEFLEQSAVCLALFLMLCVGVSLLGQRHWLPDLLAQFQIQFFAGGIILFIALLFFKYWILATFLIDVIVRSYRQIRLPMAEPWNFTPPEGTANFRLMQYNKFYKTRPHNRIRKWIDKNAQDIDLIIIQEAENKDIPLLTKTLSPSHPYGLPAGSDRPDLIAIFSKYELRNLEIRETCTGICTTRGLRFELQPANLTTPVVIYTVHTEIPYSTRRRKEHKAELKGMADWIAQDTSPNIIFLGDWNTTPYGTGFKEMHKISGLKYQNYRYLPESTWASFFLLPILKIPLDHILFKGNLKLLKLQKGPSFHSDHHSLHAWFSI